ncbi:hypothetical protein ACFWM3_14020 [Gottfriedia sp. NPDC058432]|nr:hypothetical protein [Bacillus sp. FJAT-25509]
MSTGYRPTSWPRIERDYDDIILEISNSLNSEHDFVAKVVLLDDYSQV